MAEGSDFKFGTQLGFVKAHHKITHIGKSGHGFGLGELAFAKARHKTTPRGKVGVDLG